MEKHNNSRRSFFQKIAASSLGLMVAPSIMKANYQTTKVFNPAEVDPIWRNKQEGMEYRMLGRTGMMVSELALGTYPFNSKDFFPVLDANIEKGVNYLDTAFAYSQGQVETTLGEYFKQTGNREKIFLSTKLSSYYYVVDGFVKEIMKGLSSGKQESLRKQAQELIEKRTVKRPGYHISYFPSQAGQMDASYLRHLVIKEFGLKKEWEKQIKENAFKLLEGSLKRLNTDYVDVLHCPHGIGMPEMMDDLLKELFGEFKKKGLIRAAGVSFHNDVTGNLLNAIKVGYYDVTMFGYNIANHAALESAMYQASQAGIGLLAMKVVRLFHMKNQPGWRADKLNTAIPGTELSDFAKSYLWALQNPNLSCCVSQMDTIEKLKDNIQVVGKKVEIKDV